MVVKTHHEPEAYSLKNYAFDNSNSEAVFLNDEDTVEPNRGHDHGDNKKELSELQISNPVSEHELLFFGAQASEPNETHQLAEAEDDQHHYSELAVAPQFEVWLALNEGGMLLEVTLKQRIDALAINIIL